MATAEAILASVSQSYTEIIIIAALFFLLIYCFCQSNGHPFNWPLIGMLPTCFPLTLHFCDHFTKIIESYDGTFVFKGPWFANRDMIFTADPRNVQHILSTNFSRYPKGPDTREIFYILGDILFNLDHDAWRKDRKLLDAFFRNRRLRNFNVKINQEVIEKGLIPVLDHALEHGIAIDLQDVFQRYMLDATCMMVSSYNTRSLRIGFPQDAVLNALHDAGDAILMRHILPETLWKFQKWVGFGVEKKLSQACKTLDEAAEKYIKAWKEQSEEAKKNCNAIKFYLMEKEHLESVKYDEDYVTRDIVKGLIFAGTDTTAPVLPWFFWLLSKNPNVECEIRKELVSIFQANKSGSKRLFFDPEELNKLTYLHGALCETLRLFPSAPFEPRTCIQPDFLPSGHPVKPSVRMILCTYAMGRMKSIWGEDCLEFKPQRWISEKGAIIPMASNKFVAFSSGPRICLGKEMDFHRLKAAAATILYNYQIHIIKDQPAATPAYSIFLRVKHGVMAKVIERTA